MLINEQSEVLSLAGEWDFTLGADTPIRKITVPGCWESQGFSKWIDGPAHYQKIFHLPEEWRSKHIQVDFDAVSYACKILLNGREIATHRGLWTPFSVDITKDALPGEENKLELVVYKPGTYYPMRSCLAGFIPDVSTTFGGIWQEARLHAMQTGLKNLQLDTNLLERNLRVRCQAVSFENLVKPYWDVQVSLGNQAICHESRIFSSKRALDVTLPVPDMQFWEPNNPVLYSVRLSIFDEDRSIARITRRIGFRSLSHNGNQLLLNDKPLMVRGILSWGWEPDQIAPAYSPEKVRAEIQRVRAMGFNLIKLCLFIPNQVYFDIADEEGMLLWEEYPLWLPEITKEFAKRLPREYDEITRLINTHPSVVLISLGCELSQNVKRDLLEQLNNAVRNLVSGVLVCDNSGSGESYGGLDFDFSDFTDYHPYFDIHYFEPLLDNWRRDWQKPRPWIFGEFCDSDTFRDLNEIVQASGGQRPWWLTEDNPVTAWRSEAKAILETDARLRKANLPFSPQHIRQVSYAQSMVIRKFTLEALRRRKGMGGYVVTGLRDTPISTSGIWDDFYREKWPPDEFRRVNDSIVLCLDVGRRRVWRNGGDRPDYLDAYNFWSGQNTDWHLLVHTDSAYIPPGTLVTWELTDIEGRQLAFEQCLIDSVIKPGQVKEAMRIACKLPEVKEACEYTLKVNLNLADQVVHNQWHIWCYPWLSPPLNQLRIYDPQSSLEDWGDWIKPVHHIDNPACLINQRESIRDYILLATTWDHHLVDYIQTGGFVIYLQQNKGPLPTISCPFWREAIKLFYNHPLWKYFPHRGYTDMQFFGIANDCVINTESFSQLLSSPFSVHPILRRLDAREFTISDYILEVRIGAGIVFICTLRLQGGAGNQPFGWQRNVAGGALLQSLLRMHECCNQPEGVL